MTALRDLIEAGSIGRPLLVNIAFVHGLVEQGREWIVDAGRAGGGVLFDSGCHAIDRFRFLAGDVGDLANARRSSKRSVPR